MTSLRPAAVNDLPGANSARDANFRGLTGGYRKLFNHRWQPILSASASLGRENTIAQGRQDLARQYAGGRVGVCFTPEENGESLSAIACRAAGIRRKMHSLAWPGRTTTMPSMLR